MSNRLEQFVRDHREEFDDEEPGRRVWEDIRFQIETGPQQTGRQSQQTNGQQQAAQNSGQQPGQAPGQQTGQKTEQSEQRSGQQISGAGKSKLIQFTLIRYSAAAAIILVIAGSIWFFKNNSRQTTQPGIASAQPQAPAASQNQPQATQNPATTQPSSTDIPSGTTANSSSKEIQTPANPSGTPGGSREKESLAAATETEATVNEEMYHYAKLVELKHKELKTIEKDEPLLYRQFAADVHALDSVYQSLQQQLPKNPNREQLLEAMLQNLQLQMGLLNHQLDIIKQINHSKKTAYEKAYKTA